MAFAPATPLPPQSAPQNTRSPHGPLAIPCQNCHTFSGWKPIRTQPEFDHNTTHYPLRGMHKNVGCTQCHTKPVFTNVGSKCADCHADIHRRQMGSQCDQCHTVLGWNVSVKAIREHQNRFPLLGAHALLECSSCHRGAATGQYQGLPTDCNGCHMGTYLRTKSPSHQATGFPTDCKQCHSSMDTWQGARFDHAKFTGFELTGAHARLDCSTCHTGGRFQGTSSNCSSCHMKDFNAAANPNHVKLGFPQTCSQCHTTASWMGAKFDHNSLTGFALTGAHAAVSCAQCHVNNVFQGTPTACVGCHLNDFKATTNPNHVTAGFPQTCVQCHNTVSWKGASFDHAATGFALTGAHTSVACTACHVGGRFAGTLSTCIGCHQSDFNNATNPNHVSAGFPQTCTQCHTTTTWQGAKFDHSTTGFPLTGAHNTLNCSQCHVGAKYAGTPATCVGCHLTDFNNAKNPDHALLGFPQQCTQCHTTITWTGAKFDHAAMTSFPLTGAHVNVACLQCHVGGKFAGTAKDCASCHLPAFNKTTNPNHVSAGFPTDCSLCHTTTQWPGARFDHSATQFPLAGAHVSLSCASCHASGVFKGLSTACSSCHLKEFNAATSPNHISAGFPQQCELCHTPTAWKPSSFNHSTTAFPLTGAHTSVACANCHVGGRYAGTPTDCYACHKNDYNSVANPNHVAAAFPTTCTTCHTTIRWTGATFNHTRFPIYSGSHQGKWTTCADCHANPSNFAVFTCTSCHAHDKTTMDSKHRGVRNYVYNSANCYACHPVGRAD